MSLPDPVLPIRVDESVKRVVANLAAKAKVAPGTYARQKLELALLQGVVRRMWHELGFAGVMQRLCPDLLAQSDTGAERNGSATNVHKVSD